MSTLSQKFEPLMGKKFASKKNGQVVTLTGYGAGKVEVEDKLKATKTLSLSTFERWWKQVDESTEVSEAPKAPAIENVNQKSAVSDSTNVASGKTSKGKSGEQNSAQSNTAKPQAGKSAEPKDTTAKPTSRTREKSLMVGLLKHLATELGYSLTEKKFYTGITYKGHNIAEMDAKTTHARVRVNSKALTPEQLEKVRVLPASYKWILDAEFQAKSEDDLDAVLGLFKSMQAHIDSKKPAAPKQTKKTKKDEAEN